MSKMIIGIHGLANKPSQATLKVWWRSALEEGLEHNCQITEPEFEYDMCYWAKFLYRHHLHRSSAFDFDTLYNKEPYYKAKPGDLKLHKDGFADRARATISSWIGSAVDLVSDAKFGKLTDVLMRKKLKDLHYYWDDERFLRDSDRKKRPAKEVLQSNLIDLLRQHYKPGMKIMLIAHSMGSIIAYDVLRRMGRERGNQVEIDHLVTIGSPLGLPIVKSQIETVSWDNEVRTPTIVKGAWVNFSDTLDPVCVDTHLGDDYGANAVGVQAKDDIVYNDYHYKEKGKPNQKSKPNPHKSYGYLRTPEMSRLVADFLKS